MADIKHTKMSEFLIENGFEIWDKAGKGKERIYINNKELYELGLEKADDTKGCKVHYDIAQDKFYYSNITYETMNKLVSFTDTLREQSRQDEWFE